VVHRRSKRLPPVAQAFKRFLMKDGASLLQQMMGTSGGKAASGAAGAARRQAAPQALYRAVLKRAKP
jgi:hypothetical protein